MAIQSTNHRPTAPQNEDAPQNKDAVRVQSALGCIVLTSSILCGSSIVVGSLGYVALTTEGQQVGATLVAFPSLVSYAVSLMLLLELSMELLPYFNAMSISAAALMGFCISTALYVRSFNVWNVFSSISFVMMSILAAASFEAKTGCLASLIEKQCSPTLQKLIDPSMSGMFRVYMY